MPRKPVRIPLSRAHPTEFILPQDTMEDIASYYDGTPESIKPVKVLEDDGEYYFENGNKRSAFLAGKGEEYVLGFIELGKEFPDELEDYRKLAKQAEEQGVNSLENLRKRTVSRIEYERIMSKR